MMYKLLEDVSVTLGEVQGVVEVGPGCRYFETITWFISKYNKKRVLAATQKLNYEKKLDYEKTKTWLWLWKKHKDKPD